MGRKRREDPEVIRLDKPTGREFREFKRRLEDMWGIQITDNQAMKRFLKERNDNSGAKKDGLGFI